MSLLYAIYKKLNHLTFVSTLVFFISDRIAGIWNANRRYVCKKIEKKIHIDKEAIKSLEDLKIAYVCDEMTYRSFQNLTESVYITPWNWHEVLEKERPDIFFCESAWSGIEDYKDCWRGRVYKSDKVRYNNRKVLFNILEYCKENGIKTVFWNKEDPTFFGNTAYDFIDTALHFEYIFTTAEECVEKYKELGGKNVFVLPFGFSPKLFNPMNSQKKENRAVFAGSWYHEHQERCKQMQKMFNEIIDRKIDLQIYDRNANLKETINVFPKEYQAYVHGQIPFDKLGEEIKKSQYGININTVVNSSTMFARRVYEMMACNVCIISNESQGIRKQFGDRVWFIGSPFDISNVKEICRQNVQEVMSKHTNYYRLKKMIEDMQYPYESPKTTVALVTKTYRNEKGNDNLIIHCYEDMNHIADEEYVIIENQISFHADSINQMLVHYQYLDKDISIQYSEDRYCISETIQHEDVLLPKSMLGRVKQEKTILVYGI